MVKKITLYSVSYLKYCSASYPTMDPANSTATSKYVTFLCQFQLNKIYSKMNDQLQPFIQVWLLNHLLIILDQGLQYNVGKISMHVCITSSTAGPKAPILQSNTHSLNLLMSLGSLLTQLRSGDLLCGFTRPHWCLSVFSDMTACTDWSFKLHGSICKEIMTWFKNKQKIAIACVRKPPLHYQWCINSIFPQVILSTSLSGSPSAA